MKTIYKILKLVIITLSCIIIFRTHFSRLYVNNVIITSSLFLNKWSVDFKRYLWQQVYAIQGKNIVVQRFSNKCTQTTAAKILKGLLSALFIRSCFIRNTYNRYNLWRVNLRQLSNCVQTLNDGMLPTPREIISNQKKSQSVYIIL